MYALIVISLFVGQSAPDIMRVEEDWEVVLNVPSDEVVSPQFHTVMSPFDHTNDLYTQITWNYHEMPSYSEGGLQLQVWSGDYYLTQKDVEGGPLSVTSETIRWSQKFHTTGSFIEIEIFNGQSQTWGNFGGSPMRLIGLYPIENLNEYSPETSIENSWVSYGVNRVESMRITEVRYYDGAGNLISTDSAPKTVCCNDQ